MDVHSVRCDRNLQSYFAIMRIMFAFIILVTLVLFTSRGLHARNFVVTNTNDSGPGTFRTAIDSANSVAGFDTISFYIPYSSDFCTISVQSQLPSLIDDDGVIVDGYSQPGALLGQNPPESMILRLLLDGTAAGPSHGICIVSSQNTIRGIAINGFEQDGIRIEATPEGSTMNYIFANIIGMAPWGPWPPVGNGTNQSELWAGVHIACPPGESGVAYNNVIEGNAIMANYVQGVTITGSNACDVAFNTVKGNYIGTDQFGTEYKGNAHNGVYIGQGAHNNTIKNNLICDNGFDGIAIDGDANGQVYTHGNIIDSNSIGFGTLSGLPNSGHGIGIGIYGISNYTGFATENIISFNLILLNGHNGIAIWEHPCNADNADGNRITHNELSHNQLLGIDLGTDGVTYNDTGDLDVGPNQEINFPVIDSVFPYPPLSAWVYGTIDIDTDPTQAIVEIFWAYSDATGYGEGAGYLESAIPDANGRWSAYVWGVIAGDHITTTVTDMNSNTSEFSRNAHVPYGISESKSTSVRPEYVLGQNLPNPFIDFTEIGFCVPTNTFVNLSIYDISGSVVKTLVNGTCVASRQTLFWDGRDREGKFVPPGVYIYRLKTEEFDRAKKMILLR